jgi:hypothetical protein
MYFSLWVVLYVHSERVIIRITGTIMNKSMLTPLVLGALVSAVITGCGSSDGQSDSGEKKPCEYNIQGGNAVDIMFGTAYTNPSVKVTQEGEDVSFKLEGAVDTSKLGSYDLTYTGESCKNAQIRTINVVPSSCAYKLTGNNPLQVSFGDDFIDPGFEVKDINNKVITGVSTGTVDTSIVGDYTLTYKGEGCKNSQTRKVQVIGGNCSYTLAGDNPLLLNIGDTYSDAGVSVTDAKKNTVTSTVSGTVDTSTVGDYTITYKGVGCENTKTRTVTVKAASTVCSYDLNGDNPLEVVIGGTYKELGVSIKDANSQAVTGTASGSVDTTKISDYAVTYQSDHCTNTTTRTVKVVAASCSYALVGNDPLMLSKDDTFSDPGVVVKDNAGSVVKSTLSGTVDTTVVGDYTLTYQGKDCANSKTRAVKVELQTCAYTLIGDSPLEIIVNSAYVDLGAEIKDKTGTVLEAKAMGTSAVAVDNTKSGEYVVSYQHAECANSRERIVKVRALTDDELKETILPNF